MLIGHYGAALGFKSAEKRISLGTLFIAANLPDIVWCILLLLGIEKTEIVPGFTKWVPLKGIYTPFSHGITGVFVLAILFAGAMWLTGRFSKNRFPDGRAAGILGLVVFSHILLDIPVHIKEIALFSADGINFGFGLWNYPIISNALELAIFCIGIILYMKPWINEFRKIIPVLLFGTLIVIYHLVNGLVPPPPGMSTNSLAVSVLMGILVFSAIAAVLDRRFFKTK